MLFFFSLIPATLFVVVGYFVLFSTAKIAEGGLKTFGQILAVWILVLAVVFPMAGAYATYIGFSPMESMRSMHSGEKR